MIADLTMFTFFQYESSHVHFPFVIHLHAEQPRDRPPQPCFRGERTGLRWCKVQGRRGKGGSKNAFAYTQNTFRLYAKHLVPIRKISSPKRNDFS